ncbi:MAG: T9SS type A sorting domain-containing protein [Crocinitomicaceae bacterium]
MKQLDIKSPCHENWEKFTPKPEGGFCGSCQKTVIDFTNKSNDEIKNILSAKSSESICGRIGLNQLNNFNKVPNLWQNSQNPKVIQSRFLWALILSFGLSLFTAQEAKAQEILGEISYIEHVDTNKISEHIPIDTIEVEEFIMGDLMESTIPKDTVKNDTILEKKSKNCKPIQKQPIHKLEHPILMGMMITQPNKVEKTPTLEPKKPVLSEPSIGYIYPNPVEEITNLVLKVTKPDVYHITIVNSEGKIVKLISETHLYSGEQNFNLNLSDFESGIYYINIVANNHQSNIQLIKN